MGRTDVSAMATTVNDWTAMVAEESWKETMVATGKVVIVDGPADGGSLETAPAAV